MYFEYEGRRLWIGEFEVYGPLIYDEKEQWKVTSPNYVLVYQVFERTTWELSKGEVRSALISGACSPRLLLAIEERKRQIQLQKERYASLVEESVEESEETTEPETLES